MRIISQQLEIIEQSFSFSVKVSECRKRRSEPWIFELGIKSLPSARFKLRKVPLLIGIIRQPPSPVLRYGVTFLLTYKFDSVYWSRFIQRIPISGRLTSASLFAEAIKGNDNAAFF